MRYGLRTLMIATMIGPPFLASLLWDPCLTVACTIAILLPALGMVHILAQAWHQKADEYRAYQNDYDELKARLERRLQQRSHAPNRQSL